MQEGDGRTTHTCTGQQLADYLDRSIGVSHYPTVLGEDEREEEEGGESGSGFPSPCLKVKKTVNQYLIKLLLCVYVLQYGCIAMCIYKMC